jgi:hypothetical protein
LISAVKSKLHWRSCQSPLGSCTQTALCAGRTELHGRCAAITLGSGSRTSSRPPTSTQRTTSLPISSAAVSPPSSRWLAAASPVAARPLHAPAVPINGQPSPSAPVPSVTGPIAGTIPPAPLAGAGTTSVTPEVLSAFGYQQQEFFFSGTANAYNFVGTLSSDGRWSVAPVGGSAQPYTSKLEVFSPNEPAPVQRQRDRRVGERDGRLGLPARHDHPARDGVPEGDVIVAVDAQFVGVENAILNDRVVTLRCRSRATAMPGTSSPRRAWRSGTITRRSWVG